MAIDPTSGLPVLVQNEQKQSGGTVEQHVLFAIEHERLGRAGQAADLRIPQPLSRGGIPSLDVLPVGEEEDAACRREQSDAAAVELLAPRDLAGLVVDGHEV